MMNYPTQDGPGDPTGTETPRDARTLRKAIDDARQHLVDLINPQIRSYPRERVDGNGVVLGIDGMTKHEGPSLLNQLRHAVASSTSRGGGPAKHAPIPISADAHDLLTSITAGATNLVTYWQAHPDSSTVEDRLRAVVCEVGQSTDLAAVHNARLVLGGWVRAIRGLLDPPKRLYLAAPCPRCGASMVRRRDDTTGENVQQPALQVDGAEGCTCLSCGAHWSPSYFEHLASVLGCPPVEGVS